MHAFKCLPSDLKMIFFNNFPAHSALPAVKKGAVGDTVHNPLEAIFLFSRPFTLQQLFFQRAPFNFSAGPNPMRSVITTGVLKLG